MSYRDIYAEKNEQVTERYELAKERIEELQKEDLVKEPFQAYFKCVSKFVLMTMDVLKMEETNQLDMLSLEEAKNWNRKLYEDILPENYEKSYANPTYANEQLGEEFGGIF